MRLRILLHGAVIYYPLIRGRNIHKSRLSSGERRLETVWSADQQDDTCQLDYLLFTELFLANVLLLPLGTAKAQIRNGRWEQNSYTEGRRT